MKVSGSGRVGSAGGCPTVFAGIVSAAGAKIIREVMSTPHDHLAAGPHCRVKFSASGRIGGAGSYPTICAGIVSAPGVQPVTHTIIKISAPKDHFTAGPDYRVIDSRRRRVGGAGCCPTVCAGIVSPAGVQIAAVTAAPHDHFTAGPDCRVKLSAVWRADNVRWSPCVIGARIRVGNLRKSVDAFA